MAFRSTITSKGQTTIPKEVRRTMGLKAGDGLVYTVDGERIIVRPVRGTLLAAYASVMPKKRPEEFSSLRAQARKKRARRIATEK